MRVLDVGCGWGSFALHAALGYGVDVVGVTLSIEQATLARKRVADAGLTDRRRHPDPGLPRRRRRSFRRHQLHRHVRACRPHADPPLRLPPVPAAAPGGRLLNHATCALTLRAWVQNLEEHWDEAVQIAGEGRARVWRLYMASSALGFETGITGVSQVLVQRPGGAEPPLRRTAWI